MSERKIFPFVAVRSTSGEVGLRPMLPMLLSYDDQPHNVSGLLDTGADVNVLPCCAAFR